MVKIKKEGIIKNIPNNELQKYLDLGFEELAEVEPKVNKPEPMIIEEAKTEKAIKADKK